MKLLLPNRWGYESKRATQSEMVKLKLLYLVMSRFVCLPRRHNTHAHKYQVYQITRIYRKHSCCLSSLVLIRGALSPRYCCCYFQLSSISKRGIECSVCTWAREKRVETRRRKKNKSNVLATWRISIGIEVQCDRIQLFLCTQFLMCLHSLFAFCAHTHCKDSFSLSLTASSLMFMLSFIFSFRFIFGMFVSRVFLFASSPFSQHIVQNCGDKRWSKSFAISSISHVGSFIYIYIYSADRVWLGSFRFSSDFSSMCWLCLCIVALVSSYLCLLSLLSLTLFNVTVMVCVSTDVYCHYCAHGIFGRMFLDVFSLLFLHSPAP